MSTPRIMITPLYPNHKIIKFKFWKLGSGWSEPSGDGLNEKMRYAIRNGAKKICATIENQISFEQFQADFSFEDLKLGDYSSLVKLSERDIVL